MPAVLVSNALIAGVALLGWLIVLGGLALLSKLPRLAFVLGHYALDVLVFGGLFWLYFRLFGRTTPFATMAVAMLAMIVYETVAWRFFYHGELWFLTWVDWIVPAFLVASAIYFAGVLAR